MPGSPAESVTDIHAVVARLGFAQGQVVQEVGWNDDVDNDLRFAIEDVVGTELEDEDWTGGADAVLLWWRQDDGDLVDALVDTVGMLEKGGFVALVHPRIGHEGSVDPAEMQEAAAMTGLHETGALAAGPDWRASRLVAPRTGPRR